MKKLFTVETLKKCMTLKMLYLIGAAGLVLFHLAYGVWYQVLAYQKQTLSLADFQPVDTELSGADTVYNLTDDPQLIYTGRVKSLWIKCSFSAQPGEVVAFYSRGTANEWSADRMRYARQIDGYYVFDFPVGINQVRFDPGAYASVETQVEDIQINAGGLAEKIGFTYGELLYWLILPMLVYLVIAFVRYAVFEENL